jgi:hypothetical protein
MHVNVCKYIKALGLASDRMTDVQRDLTELENCRLSYAVLYTLSLRHCLLLSTDNVQGPNEEVHIVIAPFQYLVGPKFECLTLRNYIMIGSFPMYNAFVRQKKFENLSDTQ